MRVSHAELGALRHIPQRYDVVVVQFSDTQLPFISGRPESLGERLTFSTFNPATEELLAEVLQCRQEHIDQAVEAATAAQRTWSSMAPGARGECLWRWGDLIAENAKGLAGLDTANMGKPISDSLSMVAGATRTCHYWAGMCDKIWGQMLPVMPGYLSYTEREPLGVSGIILPWNVPVASFVARVAAAVACGNSVVVKPSEFSPLSALRLAELTAAAGMPDGLVNVLTGDGEVGAMLASHTGVQGISFTGSVATGRKVNEAAARSFKRTVLELGGKSPNIVFADANLEDALRGALWGVFQNCGQVCSAGTRLVLQRSISTAFVEALCEMVSKIRVGDPTDPEVQVGPIACQKQYDRVRHYMDLGRQEARIAVGGGRPGHLPGSGLYVEPTIFTHADSSSRIAQEEVFGPVLTVLTFDDEDEAIQLANDVDYGLAASVWTTDSARLLRVAERVTAGNIFCNTPRRLHPALPYGGFKNSGLGSATGDGAIEGNTRVRRITVRFDGAAPGWSL